MLLVLLWSFGAGSVLVWGGMSMEGHPLVGHARLAIRFYHWRSTDVKVIVVQNSLIVVFVLSVREQLREQTKQYEKSENDLKALQSVGQVR